MIVILEPALGRWNNIIAAFFKDVRVRFSIEQYHRYRVPGMVLLRAKAKPIIFFQSALFGTFEVSLRLLCNNFILYTDV